MRPLLHQLALHEQMDTKTLRAGNAEMSHVFNLIPLFNKSEIHFHKKMQSIGDVFFCLFFGDTVDLSIQVPPL